MSLAYQDLAHVTSIHLDIGDGHRFDSFGCEVHEASLMAKLVNSVGFARIGSKNLSSLYRFLMQSGNEIPRLLVTSNSLFPT